MIQPVVLCGGAGTRLWPLSRQAFPKQFVPLIGGKSLLELTLDRVRPLASGRSKPETMCVGSEEHRFLIKDAAEKVGAFGTIILEPVGRNTTAAMALAALHVRPDEQLLFAPSDHHIPDVPAFVSMVRQGAPAAAHGAIVLFGVTPTFPSTAYGYIEKGACTLDGAFSVARFIEKPDASRAQDLLFSGRVLWNAGIFLCTARTLLDAMERHAPDILQSCRDAMERAARDGDFLRPAADAFGACRSESIDYAVIEKHENIVVFPFDGAWSDVGSWNAVADLAAADDSGNRISGKGLALNAENTYIHAPSRQVVALGTKDLLIIDTPDALLVAHRSAAEHVKSVVATLQSMEKSEALVHRKVARPWGWFDSMDEGERYQVKHIHVKPGASLSLQMHHHRAEHWVVVRGTAEVTRGPDTFLLTENESTYIPLGEVHRLRNPGKTDLEIIEVQSGAYLGEDDIVRFEDSYGRVLHLRDKKAA
jgi:mannose-1-phosphate guanylyltransferase / mannose-6-phosphate isomerase